MLVASSYLTLGDGSELRATLSVGGTLLEARGLHPTQCWREQTACSTRASRKAATGSLGPPSTYTLGLPHDEQNCAFVR